MRRQGTTDHRTTDHKSKKDKGTRRQGDAVKRRNGERSFKVRGAIFTVRGAMFEVRGSRFEVTSSETLNIERRTLHGFGKGKSHGSGSTS